jgi:hypothetical protein
MGNANNIIIYILHEDYTFVYYIKDQTNKEIILLSFKLYFSKTLNNNVEKEKEIKDPPCLAILAL